MSKIEHFTPRSALIKKERKRIGVVGELAYTYSSLLNPHHLMIDRIKQQLQKKIPAGSFVHNVVTLMTGTTFAQVLLILIAPILTRLYNPEDFGVYTLYTSILGILAVVASWRYELAIVLPEKDEDAANIMVLSILICFSMSALIMLLVALFRVPLGKLLGASELASWLWFMPFSLLAVGLFRVFNYWSTRRKQFKRLAVRQITQSSVTAIIQIGEGAAFHPGPIGLISGAVIGQFAATGRLAWQIGRYEGIYIKDNLSRKSLKLVLNRYKKFPIYDSWSGLLNTASTMLPALLLGYFFSPSVVGYYALGHSVLAMPISFIGGSISQVFYPRSTEAKRNGNLDQVTFGIFRRLLVIGFVPMLLITVVAPDLFAIVFGTRWVIAGEYVRWLSLWLLFVFIASPLSTIYLVMERQKDGLIVNFVIFSTRLIVIIIGGIMGDALVTIALFGITGAILWIFNCTYILHIAGVSAWKTYAAFFKQVILGLPYALIPIIVWCISNNSLVYILAAIGAGIVFLLVQVLTIKKKGTLI